MPAIRRHWAYLQYVVRHKWFVLCASRKTKTSLWRALIHDLSKFRPTEWGPYARTFYGTDGRSRYVETREFNKAWLKHQHRNPHHWQHWLLQLDSGGVLTIEIPRKYVREMVADWMGAGRAITGRWDYAEWYHRNWDKIQLHPNTRAFVEALIPARRETGCPEPNNTKQEPKGI